MRHNRVVAIIVAVALGLCSLASAQPAVRRAPPYIAGLVTAVADNGATLTVTGPSQPDPVIVKCDAATKLYQAVDVPAAQLQVKDMVAVNGLPLKLQALTVQAGAAFQQLMGEALGKKPMPVTARATGIVIGPISAVQPLTVNINGVSVEIETTAKTQIVKFQPMTGLTGVQNAAKVIAAGKRDANNLAATLLVLDATTAGLQGISGLGGYSRPAIQRKPVVKEGGAAKPATPPATPAAGNM